MTSVEQNPPRRLTLRYPSRCASCGIALSRGAEAIWDPAAKKATCLACAPGGQVGDGAAGASAAQEGARRSERTTENVRRKYGDHAAAVAKELADRDAAASWGKGSEGESRLARYIAGQAGEQVLALHDRLIPGGRANIDHIWITPTGVWVVDAKTYKGKVVRREAGPLWRRESQLYVGGRNRTALTKGVRRQLDAVRIALQQDAELRGMAVQGALCFIDAEWGLLDLPFQVDGIWVLYPGALKKRLRKDGPLARETMQRAARRLDLSLPPAAQP